MLLIPSQLPNEVGLPMHATLAGNWGPIIITKSYQLNELNSDKFTVIEERFMWQYHFRDYSVNLRSPTCQEAWEVMLLNATSRMTDEQVLWWPVLVYWLITKDVEQCSRIDEMALLSYWHGKAPHLPLTPHVQSLDVHQCLFSHWWPVMVSLRCVLRLNKTGINGWPRPEADSG